MCSLRVNTGQGVFRAQSDALHDLLWPIVTCWISLALPIMRLTLTTIAAGNAVVGPGQESLLWVPLGSLTKADMQTLLVSDLDPTLDDAAVRGASITVYTTLADAERVWRAAVAACACYVFQTFEWTSVWMNTIGSAQRVAACVVDVAAADGRTLMLLPLGIYQTRYFTSLQFLGGDATDYNAPVIDRAFASEISAVGFAKLGGSSSGLCRGSILFTWRGYRKPSRKRRIPCFVCPQSA